MVSIGLGFLNPFDSLLEKWVIKKGKKEYPPKSNIIFTTRWYLSYLFHSLRNITDKYNYSLQTFFTS